MARFNRRRGFRVALIAALALICAQVGAMAHAYSHLPETTSVSAQQAKLGIHDLCKDCLNFAPLLSAAGTPTALHFTPPQARSVAPQAQIACLVELKFRLAFRSRAPPLTP